METLPAYRLLVWCVVVPRATAPRSTSAEGSLFLALYGWLTAFAAESALAQGRWAEAVSTAAEILTWPAEAAGQFRVTALVVTGSPVRSRSGVTGPGLPTATPQSSPSPTAHEPRVGSAGAPGHGAG